jgi:mannose-6-phosphate isomerase-like protein (cupin superfamily)
MSGYSVAPLPAAPGAPEDAFLAILAAHLGRDGRRPLRHLVEEIALLSPTRFPWRPSRQPLTARYPGTLAAGPAETADLRGALTGFRDRLTWRRAPAQAELGPFQRRHAFSTLVGDETGVRIPSRRIRVGLMLIEGRTFYPAHAHAAEEIYLPLSGRAVFALAGSRPTRPAPGRTVVIPAWTEHTIWTGAGTALFIWAWSGALTGGYRVGGDAPAEKS